MDSLALPKDSANTVSMFDKLCNVPVIVIDLEHILRGVGRGESQRGFVQ